MNYKDYPNVNTRLLVRLWHYKNRKKIKEIVLIIRDYGSEITMINTGLGIFSYIR